MIPCNYNWESDSENFEQYVYNIKYIYIQMFYLLLNNNKHY